MIEILYILLAVLLYVSVVFIVAWSRKRLDIVDIAWGGAFIVAALTSFGFGQKGLLQSIVTTLVFIWGLRLSYHILVRVLHSAKEDPRYTDMRKTWRGSPMLNAYLRIFVIQGILATIVSGSVIFINLSDFTDYNSLTAIGLVLWLIGFLFESIGDAQLKKHLADASKRQTIMTSGLWSYTRHPNYFGEALQWWGVFVIALGVPSGLLSVFSPVVITILLLFVSGVPLTERRFEGRAGWDEYKRRTSVFIPLPPRS